ADLGLPDVGQELMKVRVSALLEVLESACAEEIDERGGLRRWGGTLGEWELMQARKGYGTGALLLLPLSWFLAARRAEEGIREGLPLFDGLSLGGSSRIGMKEILIPRLRRFVEADATIGEVIAELTTLTVHQHVQIALSRLAQDPRRDVSVIGIDGTHWIKERDYPPGRTASRLHQAISWLQQLGLISESTITAEGESVLERTLTTLERTATT
ncbi:uncharacterized protein METZ01_LOCUS268494, partial [marine metagenome]